MAVAQDLLDILRCPHCVSGPTRKSGDDPGRLDLVQGQWLVCQEPDCGRKYPIKEDIPVMLIDEGDKWINTSLEELPEPGRLVEPGLFSQPDSPGAPLQANGGPDRRLLLLGLLVGLVVVLTAGLFLLRRQQ